jgi:hypothetical protein
MIDLSGLTWPVILAFCNLILSSAIVITAFSLLGYMLTRSLRSEVAQTFSALLACVLLVFAGDVVVPRVEHYKAVELWLRFQWIGIAMIPAVYLHFSEALLRTTRHYSRRRHLVVIASYLFSLVLVFLALFTDLLVYDGIFSPPVSHLSAGPYYPVFVVYFLATEIYGVYNVVRARRRCLTPASRRRMTYLTFSFVAPALGVFPYLVVSGLSEHVNQVEVLFLTMVANVVVGTMLVVMAYSVAYYSVLTPDRVVRHDLIHYLLRGPIVGTLVIIVMLAVPRIEPVLGLPREIELIFAVVGIIVLGQLAISVAKPWIDRFIYRQDREEITWIQTLDSRLLTSSDLRQFLTNVLIGLCELLRVDTGFVVAQTAEGFQVEAALGATELAEEFARSPLGQATWRELAARNRGQNGGQPEEGPSFKAGGDLWFCALRSQDGERLLGLLIVRARSPQVDMDTTERAEAGVFLQQAAAAIADRYVQQGVFATLQSILPDLERIQEWRGELRYASSSPDQEDFGQDVAAMDGSWQQWVKDALSHYWGGPKLTDSPLSGLRVVRQALQAHDGNITRALRAVLLEAIEHQRPAGERKLAASEWLLYNILDLRFVQGQRVRDIARRLAMSESDLYRKQRTAVAEVAKTLAEMEAVAAAEETNGTANGEVQSPVGTSTRTRVGMV